MKRFVSGLLMLGMLLAILAPSGVYPSPASAQAPIEARLLVWETITRQDDGRLLSLTSEGAEEVLVDFPAGVFDRVAKHCSQDIWAAGGQGVALFTGAAQGDIAIYPLAGGTPIALGSAHRMACAGPTTFQFSPNAQRAGFIDYAFDVLDQEFPNGNLKLYDAASGTQLGVFDWTTTFALYDDGALMLRLFPDGKGNATEADLDWWDGAGRRTLVTLEPLYPPDKKDVECGIKNGAVTRVGDTAYVLMGQHCETGATNWRMVSVPMAGGAATEIALGEPGGGYFNENFVSNLYPTKDGAGFLMTIPSGLARNTVRMQWITPDGTITPILPERHIITDRFGERLTEGRHLMQALDGSALAFVTTTANGEQSLWMIDLTTPGGEPVLVEEEGADQRIFQYLWASNNTLFYAAGSLESSSLHMVQPGGASQRLERGRFYRIAVNYAGDKIAASQFYDNPNSIGDDLFKLSLLNTNGVSFDLREGGAKYNQFIPLALQ